MWKLDHKEDWAPKNWCFQTVVLEKTLENYCMIQQSHLGCLFKRNGSRVWKIHRHISTHYSLIHNCQEVEAMQTSINRWINKENVLIHTVKRKSASKTKVILMHATRQMNLRDIMLSEISQYKRSRAVWFHLYLKQTHRNQKQDCGGQGQGLGSGF